MQTMPASPSAIEAVVMRPGEPVNADAILAAARRLGLDLRPGVVFDRRAARCDILGLLVIQRFPALRQRDHLDLDDVSKSIGDLLGYIERAGLSDGFMGRPPSDCHRLIPAYTDRYEEGKAVGEAAIEQRADPTCRGR